ncbi:MAG TPA: tripartite tricarboxylate transporter substrate binding protein [Aestuariivirga sp.]|nr:tripartite tricarboxylate transporter substrate binding protein [Aestuariivirga sp.]
MSAITRFGLFVFAALFIACAGWAQDFPKKSVRVVAPFSPGGATDVLARLVGQKLAERWGHVAMIDNRVGAGGHIGADYVAKSAPDGYTLLVAGTPHVIGASLYKKLTYDMMRDLTPINRFATYPSAIAVHPSLPVKTVKELIALAKAHPGELNFGSAGSGSPNHLAMELFKSMGKVKMVHIPYKGGSGQMVSDLLAGHVQLASIGLPPAMPFVKTGRLRVLAVTGARRSPLLPDEPTVSEAGLPGFEVTSWYGMFAPAGLPTDILKKLNQDIAAVLAAPDLVKRLASLGADPAPLSPEDFRTFVHDEIAKWAKVVKESGARVD